MVVTFVGFNDGCDDGVGGKVMMVVVMTPVVIAAVVIMSNLFNCKLNGSICGAGSCSGVTLSFGESFLAHSHTTKNTTTVTRTIITTTTTTTTTTIALL